MPTEILSAYSKQEIFINFEPRLRPVFAAAEKRLKTYFQAPEKLSIPPDDFFIDDLLTQARDNHAAGIGYLNDYNEAVAAGNKRIAAESRRLALKTQSLALIFADAADRANLAEGRTPNEEVRPKVDFIWRRASESPVNAEEVAAFLRMFEEERERGFQAVRPPQPLVMIIGDEGCGDTATVLRITNAYRLPTHFLILNDRHADRTGFRRSNDHAQAYHEDAFVNEQGKKTPPRIPHVSFPPRGEDQQELLEPTPFEFFSALFACEMI